MPQLLINWFKADYIQGFLYVGGQEHLAVLPTAGPHFSARTHKQRHTPLRVPRGNLAGSLAFRSEYKRTLFPVPRGQEGEAAPSL